MTGVTNPPTPLAVDIAGDYVRNGKMDLRDRRKSIYDATNMSNLLRLCISCGAVAISRGFYGNFTQNEDVPVFFWHLPNALWLCFQTSSNSTWKVLGNNTYFSYFRISNVESGFGLGLHHILCEIVMGTAWNSHHSDCWIYFRRLNPYPKLISHFALVAKIYLAISKVDTND